MSEWRDYFGKLAEWKGCLPDDPPAEAADDWLDALDAPAAALEDDFDSALEAELEAGPEALLATELAAELAVELSAELASDAGALDPPGQVAAEGSVTPTVLQSC